MFTVKSRQAATQHAKLPRKTVRSVSGSAQHEVCVEQPAMELPQRTRLQEQLRRADRRSTFRATAAEIAHELLTPLNVAQARAQLLLLRESPDEIDANANVILEQIQRVADTLRRLVDAAAGEGPQPSTVALGPLIQEASVLVRPLADEVGVSLSVEPDQGDTTATIDPVRTLQLLTNVLANSIDAMPEGGAIDVKARIEQIDEPVDPSAAPGSYVHFEVRDRGTGFDVSLLYTRLSLTPAKTTPKLGLFVCRSVLREVGGWMTVTSEPGEGACIDLLIPDGGPS